MTSAPSFEVETELGQRAHCRFCYEKKARETIFSDVCLMQVQRNISLLAKGEIKNVGILSPSSKMNLFGLTPPSPQKEHLKHETSMACIQCHTIVGWVREHKDTFILGFLHSQILFPGKNLDHNVSCMVESYTRVVVELLPDKGGNPMVPKLDGGVVIVNPIIYATISSKLVDTSGKMGLSSKYKFKSAHAVKDIQGQNVGYKIS